MFLLRLILLTFLCAAIPIQGIAGLRMNVTPCPMEAGDMVHVADENMLIADHECCNDEETIASTGKMCKTGQECQTGHIMTFALPSMLASIPGDDRYSPFLSTERSFGITNVWRPPANS